MQLPTLYKRAKTGAVQTWQITAEDGTFYTIEGLVNGKLTQSSPTICKGKNIGKMNETTAVKQAENEALAKWTKKKEKGYTEDINNVDSVDIHFEPMLAHKYINYKDKLKFPLLISQKLDGLRMIATKSGLATRNGKAFKSCPHIHRILKPLFDKHPDWVIDGEIFSTEVPFEKIVSLTRKKDPTTDDLKESEKICQLWIFDGVTDNKKAIFTERFEEIKREIKKYISTCKSLVFVENFEVNSHEEIRKYHDEFVAQGMEGAMIRVPDSPYENKRSKNLLKLKNFLDEEYIIADVIEGIGNRSGMAGNLVFKLKDGRTFGSGIKGGEELYRDILINKNKYIGKKATVRYQNLTKDGYPRFPICVNIDPIDR
jgi:DNA ligase 1